MERLPSQIASAVTTHGLYPPNHPRVRQSVEGVLSTVGEVTSEAGRDSITYLIIADDLVVDDTVIRNTNLSTRELITVLKHRNVERLTVAAGLEFDEAQRFVRALATAEALRSSPHIVLGGVNLSMEDETAAREKHRELSIDQIELARNAWARFRVERNLPIDQLEELVWSLIDSIGRTTRSMLPLASLKEHDEYTFVHSVNVSLLVLAQARSYGIWGPMLHAFGMAGLLHDVGKLTIPAAVLNKPGKLDPAEWEVMKTHAKQGASYLAEIEGTSPLSIIVAFEHHLRYDEKTNYPVLSEPRVPNLASRMTAIADAYDAMMTIRPYQDSLGRAAALEVLRKRAGTFYDPRLVSNFIGIAGGSGLEN